MNASLYERDFFGWTLQQSELLKAGRFSELDTEHLCEEIEALGRSARLQLTRRLEVLLTHLLKWGHQPESHGQRWESAILDQRRRLAKLMEANPSLKPALHVCFLETYDNARFSAMMETGLTLDAFPAQPPFDLVEVLDPDYLPE
ncbi:DUF29 domain-containing protein [Methylococcus geothermalis]|uniref:DUF29 family protein n=1 Tax=Methylococcus geothermalis TaxID=2681310 RepID=A0A858Q441_9GAMM|nr:DUF29 domain-containing protein [Methylococcus geothermalis]QJD28583.1 DUF29 family protein [Methylococcus geothermalis]